MLTKIHNIEIVVNQCQYQNWHRSYEVELLTPTLLLQKGTLINQLWMQLLILAWIASLPLNLETIMHHFKYWQQPAIKSFIEESLLLFFALLYRYISTRNRDNWLQIGERYGLKMFKYNGTVTGKSGMQKLTDCILKFARIKGDQQSTWLRYIEEDIVTLKCNCKLDMLRQDDKFLLRYLQP